MKNIFFNMFFTYIKDSINIQVIRNMEQCRGVLKNRLNCSEFQYANYTFVVSLENENSI